MDFLPQSVGVAFQGDATLKAVLQALRPHAGLPLVLEYDGRLVQPGYHVTEVKAGSFVTLDCGGNPDAWVETVLQVEDLPASPTKQTHMGVEKFVGIISKVAERVPLGDTARLTFEIGPPGRPMQVFDVDELQPTEERVLLKLLPRQAICKPRHRAQVQKTANCCEPKGCC